MRDVRREAAADAFVNERRSGMNTATASLWQLVRDDYLVRRGAWTALGIVWLAAAWADLRMLIFIPAVAGVVWILMRRRGELEDDTDLL
jgi:hypothetical protein